jgi:hypothetical protein
MLWFLVYDLPAYFLVTDFWLSLWFSIDVNCALQFNHVNVVSNADVSGVHATSIFRFNVRRVNEYLFMYRFWSIRPTRGRVGAGALSRSRGTADKETLSKIAYKQLVLIPWNLCLSKKGDIHLCLAPQNPTGWQSFVQALNIKFHLYMLHSFGNELIMHSCYIPKW